MSITEALAGARPWWIECGHALEVLRAMPAGSVHCIVTSPPYWGLRDYGVEALTWGVPDCAHEWSTEIPVPRRHATRGDSTAVGGGKGDTRPMVGAARLPTGGTAPSSVGHGHGQVTNVGSQAGNQHQKQGATSQRKGRSNVEAQRSDNHRATQGQFCRRCHAWRGSLGLEPDPSLYIAHLVEIFRECFRVLRPDGTIWINMGDSYSGSGKGRNSDGRHGPTGGVKQHTNRGSTAGTVPTRAGRVAFSSGLTSSSPANSNHALEGNRNNSGLPAKSLMQIPQRLAIALQDDGRLLRAGIVWAKPAPMPESVTDRPTRSHEMIYLFAGGRRAFYDGWAIREAAVGHPSGNGYKRNGRLSHGQGQGGSWDGGEWRNARDVWTFGSGGSGDYDGEHRATFPPELPERCIKAGTSEHGVCPSCGAPWRRMLIRAPKPPPSGEYQGEWSAQAKQTSGRRVLLSVKAARDAGMPHDSPFPSAHTSGWAPTCKCGRTDTIPAVVLDPFSGSGTTVMVARRLGRRAIGIELKQADAEASARRVAEDMPMFNRQAEAPAERQDGLAI